MTRYVLKYTIFFVFTFVSIMATGQDTAAPKLALNGYVSYLQSGLLDDEWVVNNQLHNRLNFTYYPTEALEFNASIRTRMLYGGNNRLVPLYAHSFDHDAGYADLAFVPIDEKAWLVTSQIDRLSAQYTRGKYQVSIGRQRINWGQCAVWNPNDIFSTYSLYDFDYTERAGSDAVRFVYYRTFASQIEWVAQANAEHKVSSAVLFRTNKWNYDFQFITGELDEQDAVLGAGTTGNWGETSIRGELTYLHPIDSAMDTSSICIASAGVDRLFDNDLFVQTEFLYNGNAQKLATDDLSKLYSQPSSVKQLSFDTYSILCGARYPITPLIQLSATSIYYVRSNAFYAGPNVVISLKDNLDISFVGQYFNLESNGNRTGIIMAFWSLKQSF